MKQYSRHLLTEQETAEYLGLSRSFLRQGRMNGYRENRAPSPPFLKIGRAIRYEIQELNTWLEQFKKKPTKVIHENTEQQPLQ